ncbi:MAG: hypothetical protein ACK6D6_04700, partial [Planctomyces sp.]
MMRPDWRLCSVGHEGISPKSNERRSRFRNPFNRNSLRATDSSKRLSAGLSGLSERTRRPFSVVGWQTSRTVFPSGSVCS